MIGYSVYAIRSLKDNRIYVGLSKNPEKRLEGHNKGDTKSTKGYRPWLLIYKEFIGTRIKAREREKILKSGYEKELLKNKRARSSTVEQ